MNAVLSARGQNLVYEYGHWQIDLRRRELLSNGVAVPIGARAFEIIEILVQSANELVTKNDIMNGVWPGALVGENTLQVHISAIRRALGPDRAMLKTESGRGYRLLGSWTLRQLGSAMEQVSSPPGRKPEAPQANNFPLIVGRLIGRAAAARHVQDLVSAYRVVTLTGIGGVGKTSLAIEAACGLFANFEGGAWFVDLASLPQPDLVPSTVANALGLKLSGGFSAESVARAVGAKHLLLVLDNCEHVIDAAADLAERITSLCPHTTILATSREVLRVAGEAVYRVPPLDVPAVGHESPDHILGHSAVELFITRVAAMDTNHIARTADLAAVAAICRHLDGIPLAIEFAAASAATLGVSQVAIGLRDRFALLTSGRRTALARQRTLRATLDWSYQLLNRAEQKLLHRLAIFAGPFSLDAVHAVVTEDMSYAEIADGVVGLVGKSLVLKITDRAAAEFRLLETVRVYVVGRLSESGALAEVARRHAAYCLEALGTIDDRRPSQPTDAHHDGFRHLAGEVHFALEWAFSALGDPAMGLALTIAAVPLWFALSQMAAARGRVEQALPHAALGSELEMRLRLALGHTLWYTAPESDALESAFARALDISERIGATDVQIQALWGLWAARRGHGDYSAALEIARSYAEAAANAGDAGAVHLGDRILGLTHHFMGHQAIAREFAERSLREPHLLAPASGIGFQVETAAAMGALLARVLWLSGFLDQARVAANEAIAAAAKSGHSFSLCYTITLAGLPVALWTGDIGEAWRLLDLLTAHAVGIQRMEHRLPAFARLLKFRDGDEDETLIASFIESHSDPALIPPFADIDFNAHIEVPLPRAEPVDLAWNTPELLRVDAELLLWHDAPGAVTVAESKLLRALETAREQSALSWELRVAISLSRLWQRLGATAEALRLLAATYGKFTEGFDTGDLVRARSLMSDLESDSPSAGVS